jgi:hypothetical protein
MRVPKRKPELMKQRHAVHLGREIGRARIHHEPRRDQRCRKRDQTDQLASRRRAIPAHGAKIERRPLRRRRRSQERRFRRSSVRRHGRAGASRGHAKIMTPMTPSTNGRPSLRSARAALALVGILVAVAAAGCGTSHPSALTASDLAEAQTFPFYRIYWTGPRFEGHPLAAVDGINGYIPKVGDSIYYGDCVQSKGIFGGGSCELPLQVTTVVYVLHSNATLGPQSNMLIRGVPATVYDEGRSIEIYTGRVAIDIFSDDFTHALRASEELRPLNAPGSASGDLPAPVYCPGLSGAVSTALARVMVGLPNKVCQHTAAQQAYNKQVTKSASSG